MFRRKRYILWFEEIGRKTFELVGGKNASLGEMTQAGIRVPPGFAITTEAYLDFLNKTGIRPKVFSLANSIKDHRDVKHLSEVCSEIRRLIMETDIPREIEEAIRKGYRELCERTGEKDLPVAVRSSATAEDLPFASFAGQQDTYLWIKGEDSVVEHVKKCWASLFSDRATSYRIEMGFSHEREKISVCVQKMVDARSAGVMFTLNPINGDISKIVINSSWGFGEGVVSGEVTPDEIMVDKVTLEIVRKTLGAKEKEFVVSPEGVGVVEREVEEERRRSFSIEDEEIKELAKLGKRVEDFYKGPSDIEWAIDRNLSFPDSIFILQARPETVWSQKKKEKKVKPRENPLEYIVANLMEGKKLK